MVAAAKLRRAQERAISARPYATMMASVLQSLKRRIEVFDPETGEGARNLYFKDEVPGTTAGQKAAGSAPKSN